MAKNKKPKNKQVPAPQKKAKHLKDPQGYQHQFIAWHFQCMDDGGDWPCTCQTVNELMTLLCDYENMTWNEATQRRHTHPMPISNICNKAQSRLEKIGHEDAATLYQFEIVGGQKRRLWGFRQQNILQILWWDPDHTVYPMNR